MNTDAFGLFVFYSVRDGNQLNKEVTCLSRGLTNAHRLNVFSLIPFLHL